MNRAPLAVIAITLAGHLSGVMPPARAATEVKVVNTPTVAVRDPIPHSRLEEFTAIPVSAHGAGPSLPLLLDASGFTKATISLAVEVQGAASSPGMVTATLLPEVPFVLDSFSGHGIMLFPIQTGAHVDRSETIHVFGSQPIVYPLGFPKYIVFFANSSDRPVRAYLYVYLTN